MDSFRLQTVGIPLLAKEAPLPLSSLSTLHYTYTSLISASCSFSLYESAPEPLAVGILRCTSSFPGPGGWVAGRAWDSSHWPSALVGLDDSPGPRGWVVGSGLGRPYFNQDIRVLSRDSFTSATVLALVALRGPMVGWLGGPGIMFAHISLQALVGN
ncbi:hypothetical protein AFGD_005799 [Aspergillus flavus]|nr:hypothetical protein AFGD_005799 [Aspergillus flavus]